MFELTDTPISTGERQPHDARAGGFVTFEGHVRSLNDGKQVLRLEYEVYPALALSEGNLIIEEATEKFGLFQAYAIHRHGKLGLSDIAIWAYAASMRRREAFEATEYIVHSIKHRLPIWKKEWYVDGTYAWVNCQHGNHP